MFAGTYSDSRSRLLKGNGEDVKTVQESLHHADSKVTLDMYAGPHASEEESTAQGYSDDWTHRDRRI
jgi:integrase